MSVSDLVLGWTELVAAYPGYEEAERFYEGDVDEVFADPRVRSLLARTGEDYRFNFAKIPVNSLADRIELKAVTVPGSEVDTATIGEVWDANDMDVHMPDTLLRALEYGDAYLMAWPMAEVEEELEGAAYADRELLAAGVEITYHSAKHTRVIYDPENERRKAFAVRRWAIQVGDDKVWRVDVHYPDHYEQWISRPNSDDLSRPDAWEPFLEDGDDLDEDGVSSVPNEWGEVPFFHFRTGLPYGTPVHRDAYGPQNAINKLLITQLTTTDSHGWPQRYGLVDPAGELDSAHDGPDWEADADAEVPDTATSGGVGSDVRMGPGTVAMFNGLKELGQLPAADPSVFMDPAETYVRMMATVTETPFHSFDPSGDAPSGESLRVAEAPQVKRAERLGTMFTAPAAELWAFVLKLRGVQGKKIAVRWAPPQSATGASDWQVIELKQKNGVPQDQTLVEAGYDAEQVERWFDSDAEAMDLMRRVEVLGKIGAAVQSLGAGVGLGVIDQAQVNQILGMVLGQAGEGDPDPA